MPPLMAGVGKGTGLPLPVIGSVMFDGHDSSGGPNDDGGGGGLGWPGFLAQPADATDPAIARHAYVRSNRMHNGFNVITAIGREQPGSAQERRPHSLP